MLASETPAVRPRHESRGYRADRKKTTESTALVEFAYDRLEAEELPGQKQLKTETALWHDFSSVVAGVLDALPGES